MGRDRLLTEQNGGEGELRGEVIRQMIAIKWCHYTNKAQPTDLVLQTPRSILTMSIESSFFFYARQAVDSRSTRIRCVTYGLNAMQRHFS